MINNIVKLKYYAMLMYINGYYIYISVYNIGDICVDHTIYYLTILFHIYVIY